MSAWLVFVVAYVSGGVEWLRLSTQPSRAPCVNNLRMINGAKEQFMLESRKASKDVPLWEDLISYMKNQKPRCPEGGTYILGRFGEPPRCSVGGARHSVEDGVFVQPNQK